MKRHELLNKALSLVNLINRKDFPKYGKGWLSEKSTWGVTDLESYTQIIEEIFNSEKTISSRFSRKVIYKIIDEAVIEKKKENEEFTEVTAGLVFDQLQKTTPAIHQVLAPISGIRLDNNEGELSIGAFKIGRLEKLDFPIANTEGYYVKTSIGNSYDRTLSIEKAKTAFEDFARLILFMSGKGDKTILIRTGLPLYPSISHDRMYVETNSFQVTDEAGELSQSDISNRFLEKIPVDNAFFRSNEVFSELWQIHDKRQKNEGITDIRKRILNAALAIGESARSEDPKNSVIYTCMGLETLFSYDEGSIFQKSIADRMADTLAFIVAKDKDSRIVTNKLLKKVYAMRSALVHGGEKQLTNDYATINTLLRMAIAELLNNPKYSKIKKIEDIYEMVRDAHYSYQD